MASAQDGCRFLKVLRQAVENLPGVFIYMGEVAPNLNMKPVRRVIDQKNAT
jgi:hypothetical protein